MPVTLTTPGTLVAGRYELKKQLGAGSFGSVWSATDARAFNRQVAVKFLLEEHLSNADIVKRFWREGQATAALSHPNVVALLEVGEEHGVPFLVSEFVAGDSMRAVLDARVETGDHLSVDEVLNLFRQICAGVGAAHEKGIVHRDLKPENVMVQGRGADALVKVLDFGIARILNAEATASGSRSSTEAGRVIGSLQYMAPEQVLGDIEHINAATDVFALGAILFELLTLRPVFDEPAMHQIVAQILQPTRPSACARRPELPGSIDAIIARSMAVATESRFATPGKLFAATDEALRSRTLGLPGGVPTLLGPSSATSPTLDAARPIPLVPARENRTPITTVDAVATRTKSRGPQTAVFALGGLAAVGVVVAATRLGGHRPPPAPAIARTVASTVGPPPEVHATETRGSNGVETGSWVAIPAPPTPFVLGHTQPGEGRFGFLPAAGIRFEGPAFRIMAREVSWADYEAFARAHAERAVTVPAGVPQDAAARASLPVVGVSWDSARAYCSALGGDLPSEEQWEYTVRGSARRSNPWGEGAAPGTLRAFRGASAAFEPVGSHPIDATPEGVLDLAGNAQEWTASRYRTDDGAQPPWAATMRTIRGLPLRDPTPREVPPAGTFRNSGCTGPQCTASDRAAIETVGFRCVRPVAAGQ